MDSDILKRYLDRGAQDHYEVKVGDVLTIQLPRVPMTAETQFIQIASGLAPGASGALKVEGSGTDFEGVHQPSEFVGRAVKPGRERILVQALDAFTHEPVEGVTPFEITVDVSR